MSERFHVEKMVENQPVRISGSEARHLTRVMRLGPGDSVTLFDGQNHECRATIAEVQKNDVLLTPGPLKRVCRETSVRITVGTALPKGDRLRFMLEKLTEIGVHELVPVTFARSSVIPRENTLEKMRRYVIESSKQCGRNQLLKVHDAMKLADFVRKPDPASDGRWICVPTANESLAAAVKMHLTGCNTSSPIHFCIGPEGGFTNEELEQAGQAHWQSVHLGTRILRTETAAIASCHTAVVLSEAHAN